MMLMASKSVITVPSIIIMPVVRHHGSFTFITHSYGLFSHVSGIIEVCTSTR